MSRAVALGLSLGLVMVAGFGCMKCGQNVSQKIAEKAIEGAVDKSTGGRASIDVGKDVDLSGLPDFLRYPKATPTGRYSMSGKEGTGTVYTFETMDTAGVVVAFYRKALSAWKSVSAAESEDQTILTFWSRDEKQSVTVNVTKDKDKNVTSLTLLHTKRD
jgi:hypothetical protein